MSTEILFKLIRGENINNVYKMIDKYNKDIDEELKNKEIKIKQEKKLNLMNNIKYNIINELSHPTLWEEDKNKLINEAIIQHNLNFVIPMMKRNNEFKKTQNIIISDLEEQKDKNEEIIMEQEAE